MYQSSPNKWIGVATNWTINGEIICAILNPFLWSILNSSLINAPNTGGIVNAEAIAIMSLIKNNPKEVRGNDFFYFAPNLWAKALSFAKLVVVFTTNVIINFKIDWSTPGTFKWSDRFEDI